MRAGSGGPLSCGPCFRRQENCMHSLICSPHKEALDRLILGDGLGSRRASARRDSILVPLLPLLHPQSTRSRSQTAVARACFAHSHRTGRSRQKQVRQRTPQLRTAPQGSYLTLLTWPLPCLFLPWFLLFTVMIGNCSLVRFPSLLSGDGDFVVLEQVPAWPRDLGDWRTKPAR